MPKATILITRPEPEAAQLANRLEMLGYSSLVEPMLDIAPSQQAYVLLERALEGVLQGIVLTSKNALMALAERPFTRDMPLWVVGNATLQAAKNLGFTNIHTPGDAAEGATALVEYILAHSDPKYGKFIYLSAASTYADVAGMLQSEGYTVTQVPVYEAQPRNAISERLTKALREGTLDAALFFSALTARTFLEAIRSAGLEAQCASLTALCLSENIADALSALSFREVACARTPHADAMIGLLEARYGGNSNAVAQSV